MRHTREEAIVSESDSRLNPTKSTEIAVWAAAAGRCTFCNRLVLENEDLGEVVPIGELAHNVGWGEKSPRGASNLSAEERRSANNLLLLCRTCHKPIDDRGVVGRYTVDELARLKREHEQRIRFLTAIDADRQATIVRVVGPVRDVNPELSYDTVLGATTAAGLFPTLLAGSNSAEYDLDLRHRADFGTPTYFSNCTDEINVLVRKIDDGIRRGEIKRLAVFAFARIPLLIHLGARIDDKLPTVVFQRQRVDGVNAWRWPADPPQPATFLTQLIQPGTDRGRVSLLIDLSGTIQRQELPPHIDDSYSVYALSPAAPSEPHPSLISSPSVLLNFEYAVRAFLAAVEADHGKVERVDLFAAIPLSAAISLGRVLMPHISLSWAVFDRDEQRRFFEALEVRR